MGFPHHLDSSELCCRQAVTASRHLPSWQSPTDRRRTLLPYQSHRATQTPTTTLNPPPPTGIYGTPANSCNQLLPRDGTERHARLLYQWMPPHGRPGHKATTSNLSGKQIPDGASAGNIHVVRDSGKQPGEEPAGGASAALFFAAPARSPPIMPERAPSREVPRSRHRLCSQGWAAAFTPTTKPTCPRFFFCCEKKHLAGTSGRAPADESTPNDAFPRQGSLGIPWACYTAESIARSQSSSDQPRSLDIQWFAHVALGALSATS